MGWQLNGDAAVRFGEGGAVRRRRDRVVHPHDADTETGYNAFFGLSTAPPDQRIKGFVEFRWTFVNDTSPFRLALGFLYQAVTRSITMTTSSATRRLGRRPSRREGSVQREVRRVPGRLLLRHPIRGRQGHQSRRADRRGARLLPQHGAERRAGGGAARRPADHHHGIAPPSTRRATGSRSPGCGSRSGAKSRASTRRRSPRRRRRRRRAARCRRRSRATCRSS